MNNIWARFEPGTPLSRKLECVIVPKCRIRKKLKIELELTDLNILRQELKKGEKILSKRRHYIRHGMCHEVMKFAYFNCLKDRELRAVRR